MEGEIKITISHWGVGIRVVLYVLGKVDRKKN